MRPILHFHFSDSASLPSVILSPSALRLFKAFICHIQDSGNISQSRLTHDDGQLMCGLAWGFTGTGGDLDLIFKSKMSHFSYFQYICTLTRARRIIVGCWIFALFYSSPWLLLSTVKYSCIEGFGMVTYNIRNLIYFQV